MLKKLDISNYTVLARTEIEFSPGLNVITGETGVGKSLLLDAVGALLGERRSGLPVRRGADKAVIEAEFAPSNSDEIRQWLKENDLPDDLPVILRREFTRQGRTRIFINDTPVNLNLSRELGNQLLDIHGQHEIVTLFERSRQLSLLDAYLNRPDLQRRYRSTFAELGELRRQEKALRRRLEDSTSGRDTLLRQQAELDELQPKASEIEVIEAELVKLENAEKIFELCGKICDLLNEAPESAVERLTKAKEYLVDLSVYDKSLVEWDTELDNVRSVLSELNRTLLDLNQNLNHDPGHVEDLRERHASLTGFLKRWHYQNRDLSEVVDEISRGLTDLAGLKEQLQQIAAEIQAQEKSLIAAGQELSADRRSAAQKLEADVHQRLKAIGMEKARFQIAFEEPSTETPYADGLDRLDYMLAPHQKMPFQVLQKVASGGELSRILLALKSALADQDEVESLIFDEIDQGISGRTARLVGLQLLRVARRHQVIVVTHLPQIASLGDAHFSVRSTDLEGSAQVILLNDAERLEEIATLLTATGLSDGALQNAREMIASARQMKTAS
ncbi:MAG: DNA repair protein RecN [bacterium]